MLPRLYTTAKDMNSQEPCIVPTEAEGVVSKLGSKSYPQVEKFPHSVLWSKIFTLSLSNKFVWKEDGETDESRRRRISRWTAVEVTALAKIFPCSCLHLWRYSKPNWTWSCAIHSKRPYREARWSPTPTVLWFYVLCGLRKGKTA